MPKDIIIDVIKHEGSIEVKEVQELQIVQGPMTSEAMENPPLKSVIIPPKHIIEDMKKCGYTDICDYFAGSMRRFAFERNYRYEMGLQGAMIPKDHELVMFRCEVEWNSKVLNWVPKIEKKEFEMTAEHCLALFYDEKSYSPKYGFVPKIVKQNIIDVPSKSVFVKPVFALDEGHKAKVSIPRLPSHSPMPSRTITPQFHTSWQCFRGFSKPGSVASLKAIQTLKMLFKR